jgi:cation-transporting ATPase 13A3/4/5
MAKYHCSVDLRTDCGFKTVCSDELVPGDVVKIPNDVMLPCDLVLLSGSAIMNEAILTGESIPVMKTTLPKNNEIYDDKKTLKHTLFSGTYVI